MATEAQPRGVRERAQKVHGIEDADSKIAPVHNIGALSLETQPMKTRSSRRPRRGRRSSRRTCTRTAGEAASVLRVHAGDDAAAEPRVEDLEDVRVAWRPAGHPRPGEPRSTPSWPDRGRLRASAAVRGDACRTKRRTRWRAALRWSKMNAARRRPWARTSAVADGVQARAHEGGEGFRRRRRRVSRRTGTRTARWCRA